MNEVVLVTGGSGYIAGWVIIDLLNSGYRVNATVRSLKRESELRARLSKFASRASSDDLKFFQADLLQDAGWDEAAKGCTYLLHVASPVPFGEHAKANLVKSAREGTSRALTAAKKAGIKRVVLTSSVAATMPKQTGAIDEFDEKTWTDLEAPEANEYAHSKTLAEKDAWQFAKDNGLELATIQPALVLGPILGDDNSGSLEVVSRLLTGKLPALPNLFFNVVDVRDVARLHVLAMTEPQADGQRFIAISEPLWMGQIASTIKEALGAKARRVPTMRMPDFVMDILAFFQPEYKQVRSDLNHQKRYSDEKARRELGWKPISAKQSVIDCANSFIDGGLVSV